MRLPLKNLFPNLRGAPAVTTIALACVAVFAIQAVADGIVLFRDPSTNRPVVLGNLLHYAFGVYFPFLVKGAFWQPFTYIFLHGSFLHLFLNLFTLVFFGAEVERIVGTGRFWRLFMLSGVIGGLGWMACDYFEPSFWMWVQTLPHEAFRRLAQRWGESQAAGMPFNVCVGASAGVCGLIGAFAALCPEARLTILLLYVIPVRMRSRTFAILLAVFSLGAAVLSTGHVAHAAHLIGGVAGWLWARRAVRAAQISDNR
jgi:membrane associated rhomboid family serine protease